MGRRGPKPKPTLLTAYSGAKSPSAKEGPDPAPPAVVAAGEIAVATWDSTVASLRALGVWHDADRAAVARYALLTAMHDACAEEVRRDGPTVTTSSGYVTPSPASTMLLKLAASLLALEGALGLSPRTRNRMKADAPEDLGELERFTRPTRFGR
jgi:P27 family predicted phage terminase small subunit